MLGLGTNIFIVFSKKCDVIRIDWKTTMYSILNNSSYDKKWN